MGSLGGASLGSAAEEPVGGPATDNSVRRIAVPHGASPRVARESCLALLLDGLMNRKECDGLRERGTPLLRSVDAALAKYRPPSTLASGTTYHLAVLEDSRLADALWLRLLERGLEAALEGFVQRERCGPALGLGKRLRLIRYTGEERFDPHYDRVVPDDEGRESLITVLIYLNNGGGVDFSGGNTLFLNAADVDDGTALAITPRAGRVVLFEHALFHSGSPLAQADQGGSKFVIRTDVMFAIRPQQQASLPNGPIGMRAPEHPKGEEEESVPQLLERLNLGPDLSAYLGDLGLLHCSVEAARRPGRKALAAMLAEASEGDGGDSEAFLGALFGPD